MTKESHCVTRWGNRMAVRSCYREKAYRASETHIGIASGEALANSEKSSIRRVSWIQFQL